MRDRLERLGLSIRRLQGRLGPRRRILADLSREVDELAPWYQPIHLGQGVVTPAAGKDGSGISPMRSLDRGLGKWRAFIEPNLPFDLAGARVLEVGCNAGLHLMESLDHGAREAIGIEPDPHYYAQARFVARSLQRLRDTYVPLRVYPGALESFEWSLLGRFDIAFLINVIYHVGRVRRKRLWSPEETRREQAAALRALSEISRYIVFTANPLNDEGYGKGSGSLHAILDAAELEIMTTASYPHARGYVAVARSPRYVQPTAEVPLSRLLSKYFLSPCRSAEKDFADRVADGIDGIDTATTRYFRLRTGVDDWSHPSQASLPEGLDRQPVYWIMPWACKPRRPTPAESASRIRAFPELASRFRALMTSLAERGFDPTRGRVATFRLIDPGRGEVYQYIDGNQRLGIMAHLAERRGQDPLIPVTVEQEVRRDRLMDYPLTAQLVEEGRFTEADVLRWFEHAFNAGGQP